MADRSFFAILFEGSHGLAVQIMLGVQIAVLLLVGFYTVRPLFRGWQALKKDADVLRETGPADPGTRVSETTRRAWSVSVLRSRVEPAELDAVEPETAFEPHRLLPRDYNHRLDTAASGFFVAIGILGTFVGLMIGFWDVDASRASDSVNELVGAMVVAFVNSLVGVFLSVAWAITSKFRRQAFDARCADLEQLAERHFRRRRQLDPLLAELRQLARDHSEAALRTDQGLKAIEAATARSAAIAEQSGRTLQNLRSGIEQLTVTTERSGQALLDGLTPKLADSFKMLIAMPFDRLSESVQTFEKVVDRSAVQYETLAARLDESVGALAAAKEGLTDSLESARSCVLSFRGAASDLTTAAASASAAADTVTQTTVAIRDVAIEVGHASQRYADMSDALKPLVEGLGTSSAAMARNGDAMAAAATGLERSVAEVKTLVGAGIQDSVGHVRAELSQAIEQLIASMEGVQQRTAAAYEAGSDRIIENVGSRFTAMVSAMDDAQKRTTDGYEAVSTRLIETIDERVSDLTDRLAAELSTLASRLPEEVNTIQQAMLQVRSQIQQSVRAMQDASNQLAVQTPQAMQALLKQYDRELGKAVDHFSGTLSQWDARVRSIEEFSKDLRRLAAVAERRYPQQVVAL